MINERIGRLIKRFRKERGLTQIELAEKINVSFQQIQKYEKGTTKISVNRLFDISKALEIPVRNFFEDRIPEIIADIDNIYKKENEFHYHLTREEETFLKLFRKITNKKIRNGLLRQLKGIMELKSDSLDS